MNKTAVINIKTDPKLKKAAQEVAEELGLSLSSLVNSQLKEVVRTKKVSIKVKPEIPNASLIRSIKQAEKDWQTGRISPTFDTAEEAIAWLNDPNATYQNGLRAEI